MKVRLKVNLLTHTTAAYGKLLLSRTSRWRNGRVTYRVFDRTMFDQVNTLSQKCGEVSFYPRKTNEMNVPQTSSQVSSSFSQALSALVHARPRPLGQQVITRLLGLAPSKRFAVYSRCVIVYNTLQCLRPQLETPLPALLSRFPRLHQPPTFCDPLVVAYS
jgi:hypothetical protein